MKQLCDCGCGVTVDINTTQESVPFKITVYSGSTTKPLEVERLTDNVKFRVGDTIKRITLNNKKYKRFVLTKIVESTSGLLLWGYVVDTGGMVRIDNDKPYINSNQNPNIFKTLYK